MSETEHPAGEPKPLFTWLPGPLATALDRAASDAGESRAAAARRLLSAGLIDAGYLAPPIPPHPLRERTSRRRKTA